MNTTFKQGWPCVLLAAAAALVSPGQVQANECVIEIALGKGQDNYVFNSHAKAREVGYWDVDSGGAQGQGQDLGSHFINLSALIGPMSSQECIEDIRLVAGDWNEQRNPPMGYSEAGWWDVDGGGSGDSNNKSTEHRMTLFVKKMPKTSEPAKGLKVIQDIGLSISNNRPSGSAGKDEGNGFTRVGWWDVDDDTGCGYLRGQKSCGSYGAILSVKKANFVSGEEIKALVLTGRWEALNTCRGSQCSETSFQLTVGAEQGKEISRSSTTGQALSVMIGSEVKASGKAGVPLVTEGGVEVTAKLEVTGSFSWEQQEAIMNSFTSSRQATTAVSCSGANVMWQWKSNLRIQRANRVEDVAADSLLTVCAPIGVRPPHPNDISWDPEANAPQPVAGDSARRFPLAAGATFDRGGEQVRSPSGNHYAVLQSDGNFVVKTRDGGYVWGLDRAVPEDKRGSIARITFQPDGNLVAYTASGGYVWSALHAQQPAGATLRLSDGGILQIVLTDGRVVWEGK
ncbi:MAG: hypothetical protein RLZZ444_1196 [Pseudomonadota bacterium]|jgi:hypothetical protein